MIVRNARGILHSAHIDELSEDPIYIQVEEIPKCILLLREAMVKEIKKSRTKFKTILQAVKDDMLKNFNEGITKDIWIEQANKFLTNGN